jgi:hypothetical protein
MRKRLSYANVAATLALVFSMTGGALAANHYLISSTKQIKPSVLAKLKGNAGARGAQGGQGGQGPQGAQGPAGPAGPAGSAVAFARILGSTESKAPLDTANSKNVTAASEPIEGVYCLTVSVPFSNITGMADLLTGTGTIVTANTSIVPLEVESKLCPAGSNVLVETTNSGKGVQSNFWITFN